MKKIINELRCIVDRLYEVVSQMDNLSCDGLLCGACILAHRDANNSSECLASYIEECIIPELEYAITAYNFVTKED